MILALGAGSSSALAGGDSAGDQQYCDPFGGCPDSGSGSSQKFNYHLGKLRQMDGDLQRFKDIMNGQGAAPAHSQDPQYQKLLAAARVLQAAGLDSLVPSLPLKTGSSQPNSL